MFIIKAIAKNEGIFFDSYLINLNLQTEKFKILSCKESLLILDNIVSKFNFGNAYNLRDEIIGMFSCIDFIKIKKDIAFLSEIDLIKK